MQRFLTDLGQRIATRTVVLCKAVAVGNESPDIASSQKPPSSTADQHYRQMTEKNQRRRPTGRLSDDLEERASASTGNINFIDSKKYFRSVDDVSNLSGSGTIHRLRHRRHHHRRRQARDRKQHIRTSPFDRKYYWRRSKRDQSDCGGRNDVTEELDVERVAAIMKAYYCWDDEVARLTNQLQQSADKHLQMTSSTSHLRCRLTRRYDECRRNFIDKVFRTENGLPISWPRQVTDVMDRDDYSAIYY